MTWLVIKTKLGYEVVEDLGKSSNKNYLFIRRWDGEESSINRTDIIVEKEMYHDAIEAKLRGEAKEKQIREYYFAILACYKNIKHLMETEVENAIKEIPN